MGLYEHADVEGNFEMVADLLHSLLLAFAAAIGEEDEWYALFLEIAEGFASAGKGIGAAKEDAIDTGTLVRTVCGLERRISILKCKCEV